MIDVNIFKLLIYNVAEHNRIQVVHVASSWPSFWTSLRRRYVRLFRKITLKRLYHYWKHPFYDLSEPLKPLTFVTISGNNDRAMDPMKKGLAANSYSVIDQRDQNKYVPNSLVLSYSLLYIWPLLKCYFAADKERKSFIAEWFDDFFNTMGYMVIIEKLLRHSDVKLIVMANDHVSFNRAFLRVAQELGIKTMYVQHCSVTTEFPPLEFTYSFLDGEESLLKYLAHEYPKGNVYLSGNSRFDVIANYKQTLSKRPSDIENPSIGIASNPLDNEDVLKQLCLQLQKRGYSNLAIRPHPGVPFDPTWFVEHGIAYSDSNVENPFEFISSKDYVLAGDCGIHLDVVLMKRRAIYYNTLSGKPTDSYEFIPNGIVEYADNVDDLMTILQTIHNEQWYEQLEQKARWYDAAYGTKYEGHIGEMLADFLRYEQAGDVDGFDKKYGFVERTINGCAVKVFDNELMS